MQLPTLNLREMAVLTIQGKLGFLVLMKNQLRLNPKDQSMKLDAFLMTPLKKWWHHQERSIYCLQRYVLLFLKFKREMQALEADPKRFLVNCIRLNLFSRTCGKMKPSSACYFVTSSRIH